MTTTITVSSKGPETIALQEGHALNLSVSSDGNGAAYLLDDAAGGGNATQSWTLAANNSVTLGPFPNTRRVRIACSSGTIQATSLQAVLNMPPFVTGANTPSNSDGVPDGSLYYQPSIGLYTKNGGKYSPVNSTLAPRKLTACDMPTGRLGSGVVSGNSTWRMARSLPASFKRVRCHLFNIDTANTIVGAKAQFSLSESLANVNKPTIGGVASDANWKQFLFAGSGTVTQAVAPSTSVPSITTSDWYDISSIAPTDGSGYPVIYADRYIPSGNTAQCGYATPGASWASYVNALAGNKHKYRFFSQIGVDAIANPAGFTVNAEQQFVVPMALEFEFANGIRSMMTFGDSTKEGKGNTPSDSAYCGSSIMVQALFDQTATPLVVCNFANDGQTSVVGYAKFQAMLAVSTPNVVYFQPWSANDGAYSALAAAAITRAANVVQLCQQKGCKLIMETPLPINAAGSSAISTTELNALRSMEFAFLSYASDSIRVLDMRDLHDPAKPGVWNVAYGNDALHPNPAGHQVQMQKLYAELSTM